MSPLQKRGELVETMILETQNPLWVALSMGGCGILTRALVGRHDADYQDSKRIGLAFACQILQAMGLSSGQERVSTPQILVEAADALIDDPEHVVLLYTTWQRLPEGVEICSVGSNSVLVFEQESVREALRSHSVNELLRSQGKEPSPRHWNQITHALGSRTYSKSCRVEDVRVALIPFSTPITTIAIIENRPLADALLEHPISGKDLPSFIDAWNPPRKKVITSVILSLF